MTIAYIGLGSNLGNRQTHIDKAMKMLGEIDGVEVSGFSDIIETEPLDKSDQPKYLNTVAQIKTSLNAEDLHNRLLETENALGRVKKAKWSPRIIDLDLLLFGTEVVNRPDLTVPHPQMHLRSFVLKGLSELDGRLVHPVLKEPVKLLAERLNGEDFILKPQLPQLVSIAGIIGVGKTTLAKTLSSSLGCKLLLEPYDTNPFMPDVYAGKKELALNSQIYFLTHRLEQLSPQALASGQIVVTDYVFDKELIYARRLLDVEQLDLYEKIYQPLSSTVAAPVLVIYLTDSPQKCLERIYRRNRPYEQKIELKFLQALNADYEQLFTAWKLCPVIRISMSNFDCTQARDIEHLTKQIKSYIALQT